MSVETTNRAIAHESYIKTVTFAAPPKADLRKRMLAKGYEFKHGQWRFIQRSASSLTEEEVASLLSA